MVDAGVVAAIKARFAALKPVMDERICRLYAAAEAKAIGRGGPAAVTQATGILGKRIRAGLRDLAALRRRPPPLKPGQQRIRRPGAGRKRLVQTDPTLLRDLESLVEPSTRGDPQSPLRWTCTSVRKRAAELRALGHTIGPQKVSELLADLGDSLQRNRKTPEGAAPPDRNAQFAHLNAAVTAFQQRGAPVISVDTTKKELVGDFKNAGREWQPQHAPTPVRVHDFLDPALGKAIPYGVYDVGKNAGWVNVGVDHDTAEFAVEPSAAGGAAWGAGPIRTRPNSSSPPTAAGATALGRACGTWRSRSSPRRAGCASPSPIPHPARARGTRSSTACSATSPSTGVAGRWKASRRLAA